MAQLSHRIPLVGLCMATACLDQPPPSAVERVTQELSGREGKIDYEIDAPWRLEPVQQVGGSLNYGPIPIQLTIDDAHLAGADDYIRLGDFISMTVQQQVQVPNGVPTTEPNPRTYHLEDLAEIELESGPWPYNGRDDAEERTRPLHQICEPWKGQSCEDARNVGETAKWYALAWYDIDFADAVVEPGDDVPLEVTVRVEAQLAEGEPYGEITLRGHLLVHLGEAPLPNFGRGWIYGDLHYHSQVTDNEGESGSSYRGVVRAMGAMGLGFTFATDHASYSEQLIDLDLDQIESISNYLVYNFDLTWGELRDLSPERFRYAIDRINHTSNGANRAATDNQDGIVPPTLRQHGYAPKLFLGSEVDVGPELTVGERYSGVHFGNGRIHELDKLCGSVPEPIKSIMSAFLGAGWDCETSDFTEPSGSTWATYWIKDWQGFGLATARQHVLHLPESADPEAFVPSRSSQWGGGTRPIHDVLSAAGRSGVSFLAHPLASSPDPDPGPNMVPYSEYQLKRAFAEPTMLGLQLWNENGRLKTTSDDPNFINTGEYGLLELEGPGDCRDSPTPNCLLEVVPTDGVLTTHIWEWQHSTTPTYGPTEEPFAPNEDSRGLYSALHHGTYTWDNLNKWGLNPSMTRPLSWLPAGEPRRVFASAGSDAHGDFNYRRSGYFVGTDEVNTTALGGVRNLVDIGPGGDLVELPTKSRRVGAMPLPVNITQKNVTSALTAGRFTITDGPALRIVIDRNRNGIIDNKDTPMGGIVNLYGDEKIPLLIEWETTPEFGPMDQVHIYVGAVTNGAGRVYAPGNHGVRSGADPTDALDTTFIGDDGKYYYRMKDNYYLDPTAYGETLFEDDPEGNLTIRAAYRVGDQSAYHNVAALELDPSAFPSGYGDTTGMFIRAFGRTAPERWNDCDTLAEGQALHKRGKCLVRLAYTNPIWAMPQDWQVGQQCPEDSRGIDRDGDGFPDGCDWCPDDPRECGPDTSARNWTRSFGGSSAIDFVDAVAHDTDGNVYVAGNFAGTAQFSGRTLTSEGAYDGFIAKLSRTGELLWLKQVGGSGNMRIHALVVDDTGVVTFAGWFAGRMKIDRYNTLNGSDDDMFVASIYGNPTGPDPYTRWVRQIGGAGRDVVQELAIGPDRSVYAAGSFSNKLMIYGKTTGDVMTPKTASGYDCVMMRFTRSGGKITGSRQVWGSGDCFAQDLVVRSNHDLTMVGRYSGEARFDPSNTSTGIRRASTGYNGFAVRYRPTSVQGSNIASTYYSPWNVNIGDGAAGCNNGDARATGIADNNGALVVVGHFKTCAGAAGPKGSATIGSSTDSYFDGFAMRIDQYGGIRDHSIGNGYGGHMYYHAVSATDDGYAIAGSMTSALGQIGGVWFGGWTALGPRSAIVATVNNSGTTTWAKRTGGTGTDYAFDVSLFRDGFLALGGRYERTLQAPGLPSVTSTGYADGFVFQKRP